MLRISLLKPFDMVFCVCNMPFIGGWRDKLGSFAGFLISKSLHGRKWATSQNGLQSTESALPSEQGSSTCVATRSQLSIQGESYSHRNHVSRHCMLFMQHGNAEHRVRPSLTRVSKTSGFLDCLLRAPSTSPSSFVCRGTRPLHLSKGIGFSDRT